MYIPGILMGAGQAYSSAVSAREQEKTFAAERKAGMRAHETRAAQIKRRSRTERERVSRKAHIIEQRIRVAAGESGIGLGGTYEALMRQSDIDEETDRVTILQNSVFDTWRSRSMVKPEGIAASPWAAGALGMLSGIKSGLSLGADITRIGEATRTAATQRYESGIIKSEHAERAALEASR